MCGVAGIVERDGSPASAAVLERMTRALAHRGPNDEGVFTDGPVGLGHRRLSIIDLTAAGHQPMESSDGRNVISYNGEVYNFRELRARLEARGRKFRSRTDTEVVLEAWSEWGDAAIQEFNGMFAFALLDRPRREVVLARDRSGVKPLYWTQVGDTVLFGSEIKSFLAHPAFRAELDPERLVEYLTFQNFIGDGTLFRGVRILPPATLMRIPLDQERPIASTSYWDYRFVEETDPPNRDEMAEELDRLLRAAVTRQLVSDVDVGAYLSGGLDTGAITMIASAQLPAMRSFTVGFDLSSASGLELGFDERRSAERLSYLAGTEHYEMVLKAGDMQRCLAAVTWHLEEPRVGQSYPNYYAAKLASRFGPVVLSGTGGDELFGGYPWRYHSTAVCSDFNGFIDNYYSVWQRLLPAEATKSVLAPLGPDACTLDPKQLFGQVFVSHNGGPQTPEDSVNLCLYFEAKTFLHGLLVVEDKLSMAHGLETRVPMLDNDLVDFALRVPVRYKLGDLNGGWRLDENTPAKNASLNPFPIHGKQLLRDVAGRHVGPDIPLARKQGFSAPDASWFRGESIDYVRRTLLARDARVFSYLDRTSVQELVRQHLDGRHNRRLLIWSLLTLEQWLAVFCEGVRDVKALV
jgi:asparagine synthase (glutamine-hydrolysing)